MLTAALGWISCAAMFTSALLFTCPGTVCGQESEPIRFRRLMVPQDKESQWPREPGVKYIPVPLKDFEDLVDLLSHGAEVPESERRTRIVSAAYHGALQDHGVLTGTARFQIEHTQSTPALLPLHPFGPAIVSDAQGQAAATWTGDKPSAASVGMGSDGRMSVLVTKGGTLEILWSLQGVPTDDGGWQFSAGLPRSPMATLDFELPSDYRPALGKGVLFRDSPAPNGRKQWHAQLGSDPALEMRVSLNRTQPERTEATVRQSTRYELTPRGIQISATWTIDTAGAPLHELSLQLDPGVNLLEARQGDVIVARAEREKPAAGEVRHETLAFSTPLSGVGRSLRLTALAPLEFGQLQRLPTIQAEGVAWREGEAVLQVSPSLGLQHLKTTHCRQSAPLTEGLEGQEVRLQLFAPTPEIEFEVWYRPSHTVVGQVSSVELTGSEIRGQCNMEFSQLTGDRFEILGTVGSHWTIDSLETEPPGGIVDWSLTPGVDETLLRIRLAHPILPERPIKMVTTGRWLESPVGQSLAVSNLVMMRFPDLATTKELLAVRAAAPDVLEFTQFPRNMRVDVSDLTTEEVRLLGGKTESTLLRLDARGRQVEVSLQRQPPRFRAATTIDATVTPDALWESYTLRVVPESGGLQRLLVQLSRPAEAALEWSWGSDASDDDLTAKRLDQAQRVEAGISSDMEAWLLTWQRARTTPFELRASRISPFTSAASVSLMSVPEARGQEGRIQVWVFGTTNLGVESANLQPMHPEIVPQGEASTQRAAFLYDPQDMPSSALDLKREAQLATGATGLVWRTGTTSLWESDGRAFHRMVFWVENIDSDVFRLTELAGCEVEQVTVDGVHTQWERQAGELLIDLPLRRRFVTVVVLFSSESAPLGLATRIAPPQVHPADFPQLRTSWKLWLPPDFLAAHSRMDTAFSPWWRKVFGSLVRPADERPFDPFSALDWERLANSFSAESSETDAGTTELNPEQAELLTASNATLVATAFSRSPAPALVAIQETTYGDLPWQSLPGGFPVDRSLAWSSFEFQGELPDTIFVVSENGLQAWGWTLLLLGASLIWCVSPQGSQTAMVITALAMLVAAMLPSLFSPLGSGLVQGMFLGWALRFALPWLKWKQKPAANRGNVDRSGKTPSVAKNGLSPVAKLLMWTTGASLVAVGLADALQAQPTAATIQAATVHKVFYPTDKNGEIAGEYCFVPDALYDELHRRAAAIKREPRDWLLRGVRYRATVHKSNPTTSSAETALATVTATLEFDVFRDRQPVRLDFGQASSRRPTDAVLGSDTISIRWENEGRHLVFTAPRSGTQRLELQLQPEIQSENGQHRFDLGIPRSPSARLEVLTPILLPIEVLSAVGPVRTQTESKPVVADLGPSSRLQLRWQSEPKEASSTLFDVHEMYWLQVKPGAVVVQSNLKLQFVRGAPGFIRIAVDPRLRLLEPAKGVQLEEPDPTRNGENPAAKQIFRIALNTTPLARETVAEVAFVFRDTTGVGRLPFPEIRVLGARSTKRSLAVSLDKSLKGRPEVAASVEVMPANVFLSEWKVEASEPPTFAFRVHGAAHDWWLWSEPREPLVAADQLLRLSVGGSSTEVKFEARLTASGGPLFRYRLRLPAGLKVNSLSIREQDTVRPARWSRESDGWISIFLSKPAVDAQTLILEGAMPLPRKVETAKLPVPIIELAGVDVLSDVVEFYQQPGVDVVVSVPLEDVAAAPAMTGSDRWLGRWWRALPSASSTIRRPAATALQPPGSDSSSQPSALQLPSASASLEPSSTPNAISAADSRTTSQHAMRLASALPTATIEVAANSPRVQGTQTVWLYDAEGAWHVGMDLQFVVRQGRLDELAFDIPATISEPIQLSDDALVELEPIDLNAGRRRMVIRPARSLKGAQRLQLSARLLAPTGQRLNAPDIRPLFSPTLRRLVMLPATWSGKPIAWHTQRLPRVEWPSDLALPEAIPAGTDGPQNYEVHRVQSPTFQAALHSVEPQRGLATVLLADISLATQADGTALGVARFDVDPAGKPSCQLQLPAGAELLHATVANLPAMLRLEPKVSVVATTTDASSSLASTGADGGPVQPERGPLPQRWQVQLVSSRLVQRIEVLFRYQGVPGRIEPPMLVDLPVEQTLWTLQLPSGFRPTEANMELQPASALELARVRKLSEVIAAISFDESLEEMIRWYQPWVQRLQLSLGDLRQSAGLENNREALAEAEVVYDFQRDVARQLALEAYFDQAERARALASEPGGLWQSTAAGKETFYAMSSGPVSNLQLEWTDTATQSRWDRYQAGFAVLATLGLAALVVGLVRRLDLVLASPQWLLVAAGVAWWLWLSPSFLGLVIVALGLLMTVPFGWRAHRRRALFRSGKL